MGRDKAMLELEGKTLLARAVDTLRSARGLQSEDGRVEVTICGERDALEGADRAILDRYPSCGPLGGIEAALNDLATRDDADWAFFIPVDMPLLSEALIEQLLAAWVIEFSKSESLGACLVEVEGRPQPLVSLIHRSALELVREALLAGRYKVVSVLQSIGACCALFDQELLSQDQATVSSSTPIRVVNSLGFQWASLIRIHLGVASEDAVQNECSFRECREQFINVNTEADLIKVATLLRHKGSNNQPEPLAR